MVRHGFGLQKYFRSASQALEARDKELDQMAKEINAILVEKWEENEKRCAELKDGFLSLNERSEWLRSENDGLRNEIRIRQDEVYKLKIENVNMAKDLREASTRETFLVDEIKEKQFQIEKKALEANLFKEEASKLKEELQNCQEAFQGEVFPKIKEIRDEVNKKYSDLRDKVQESLGAFIKHLDGIKKNKEFYSNDPKETSLAQEAQATISKAIALIQGLSHSSTEVLDPIQSAFSSFNLGWSHEISCLKDEIMKLGEGEPNNKGESSKKESRKDSRINLLAKELSERDKRLKAVQEEVKRGKNEARKLAKELRQANELKVKAEKESEKMAMKVKKILKFCSQVNGLELDL